MCFQDTPDFSFCYKGKLHCLYLISNIPYRGYDLRGAIFADHQIFHLAVIFAIEKFANHCMYCVTFVWPDQFTRQSLIGILIISTGCKPVATVVSWYLKLWVYSRLPFVRRCGQV